MKKVIRLTESDLVKIVKRVISEQSSSVNTMILDECGEKFGYPIVEGQITSNKFIDRLTNACYWFDSALGDWNEEGIVNALKIATPKTYSDGQKILQCAFKRGFRSSFTKGQEFSANDPDPIMSILRKAFKTYGITDIGDSDNLLKAQKELNRLGIKTKI